MHRRLVFEEPVSRAAIWSRRLALFGLTVVTLAVLIFRFGQPSVERLAPIAGAYVFVLLAFLLALAAFVRIWQEGHRGVAIAVQAFLLCLLLLAPVAYGGFQLATLPLIADVSTDIDEPPAFSRSRVALGARGAIVPPDVPAERRKAQRQGYPKAVPIVLELPAEMPLRQLRPREDHDARGVPVQPMHQERLWEGPPHPRLQAVPRPRRLRRHAEQARGLVEDEERAIGVNEPLRPCR